MKRLSWVFLLLALVGCSTSHKPGGYYKDDGPHRTIPVDISKISDAVPKQESLSKSGNRPYSVFGKTYYPMKSAQGYRQRGIASWYGKKFHGHKTSSGEHYDMYAMTAAHKTLPLPSYVRVTNLVNGRSVIVRVNDRGPFLHKRIIDLSYSAATKLGFTANGTGKVEIAAITSGDDSTGDSSIVTTQATPDNETRTTATKTVNSAYLQVGAFSNRENAIKLRDRLKTADINQVVIQPTVLGNRKIYRVRVGPLASVKEGNRIADRVSEIGITDTHVVVD